MISVTTIPRRLFLRLVVGLSALGLIRPARAWATLVEHTAPEPLASKLANAVIQKDSAAVVGREYLRRVPEEADVHRLVDGICSCYPVGREGLIRAGQQELRARLRDQQRQDFENGHIVKLQGWILSETEVRLCALAALL